MKYDSGMTHLNDTVMANLRRMCSRDKAIIEKYCTEDATPAQLQDFLKSNCSSSGYNDKTQGIHFWCSRSKVEITLDTPVNNDGDKTLTLSWPQATKFIMNNWKEILGKSEPEEAVEAKLTYKDVFLEHYPSFDVDRFEEFVKVACVEYYFEASPSCDHECKSHWKSECLSKWRDDIEDCDLEILKKYLVTNVGKKAPEPDKTYKDILLEHYPNFDMSQFNDFIASFCIENFFDIGGWQCSYGVTSPAGDDDFRECRKHWENKCLHEWRKENDKLNLNDIEEYLIPEADETPAQEIVPANAEEKPAVFDYSELDGDTADKLREVSERVISIKARYIIETAKQVKIAHDLLAKCGNGNFGKWCESVGFTRQTGNNLVHVAEVFPEFEIVKNFDNQKNVKALLYAASKPSAPPELVEAVKSGDITSHKDFIAMKKQLETTEMQLQTYQKNYMQMNKNFQEACEDNTELEKRIKELESRPRDVVIQPDEKVLEENAELKKQIDDMQSELMFANCKPAVDIKEFYETLHGAALSAIRDCEGFAKGHPECRARFKMFAEVIDDCIKEMEE